MSIQLVVIFVFYEIKYKIILMLVYEYNKDLIENYPVILY